MNEETFLSALHEHPADEVTWLALADWLDEAGQLQRAEMVRLVRQLRTLPVMRRTKPKAAAEDRLAALLCAGVRPVVPTVSNSVGMRLALIPPGRFRRGSPAGERGRHGDEAVRLVTLTRPFYLGVFTVTQPQYQAVIGANPSFFRRDGEGASRVRELPDEELAEFPVDTVSWHDAQAFCVRLNQLDAAFRYRLPSEAEWEYACRCGTASSGPCCFGASLSSAQANFNGERPYGGAPQGPFLDRTCRAGAYLPNAWGLYGMHGNIWEWCSDCYAEYEQGPQVDPQGPAGGDERVLRGGGWNHFTPGADCRSASRGKLSPDDRYFHLGFRVAATRQ